MTDRGSAPVELAGAVALLLVPVTLTVLALGPWLSRQLAARVAAREAARVVVLADTFEDGQAASRSAVDEVARNHGLPSADFRLVIEGELARGASVTAAVTVPIPILIVPGLGEVAGPVWSWTARHTEMVDLYRSLP